jgi:SET domain-containing protein
MIVHPPTKIYISKSPIHGLGVFAKQKILAGELIEETPLLDLHISKNEPSSVLIDYRFNWPQGSGGNWDKQVMPFGYGAIYNHSDVPNAYWRSNNENETFEFIASKDIEKDEEIFTYYGNIENWSDGITNTKVI